jgi:TetR/AcrR family transcriptional regulator, repressor for uid operon
MKTDKRHYEPTETRQAQLLESAAQLIATKGLAATTMPDIAKNAGLSVGGLYRHFGSKSELIAALVVYDAEITAARLESLDSLHSWALEQLLALNETSSFVLRLEILALAAREPSVAIAATSHDSRLNQQLLKLIERASHPSSLGAREPELAIELLASVIDGIATRSAIAGELTPATKEMIDHTITSIISARKT